MLAGFLFKGSLRWPTGLLILGALVTASSVLALGVRFSAADEGTARPETGKLPAEIESLAPAIA